MATCATVPVGHVELPFGYVRQYSLHLFEPLHVHGSLHRPPTVRVSKGAYALTSKLQTRAGVPVEVSRKLSGLPFPWRRALAPKLADSAVAGAASRSGGAKADRGAHRREAYGRRLTGAGFRLNASRPGIPSPSCFTSPRYSPGEVIVVGRRRSMAALASEGACPDRNRTRRADRTRPRPRPQGARHSSVQKLSPASRRPWARSERDGSPHAATMTPPAWKQFVGRSCSYDHPQDDVGAAVPGVLKEVPLLCSLCGFAAADENSHPAFYGLTSRARAYCCENALARAHLVAKPRSSRPRACFRPEFATESRRGTSHGIQRRTTQFTKRASTRVAETSLYAPDSQSYRASRSSERRGTERLTRPPLVVLGASHTRRATVRPRGAIGWCARD